MNITKNDIDKLNATLKLQLSKEDYEDRVSKVLNDYRKKANMPGFRPGKVPPAIINKMYRKAVLADEINKLVSEKLNEYIKTENIHVLGDPLPSETENKTIDWENDTDFEFVFDLGLSPEIDFEISKKDKIPSYEIRIEDSKINNNIKMYERRYGRFIETEVVEENELIKGNIAQTDSNGILLEDGIKSENISLYLELAKDENEKILFKGAKPGDIVKFDIKKAFPNDTEISSLLKIDKDTVAEVEPFFQMTINTISRFEPAALNEELFNKIYGEGVITSEESFRSKIENEINENLKKDTGFKFLFDSKKYFLKKLNLKLPDAFLKRWLKFMNEGKLTVEQIEKEYPHFEDDMKWQLIKNKISKDNNIEVKEEEVLEYAKEVTRTQFQQYGLNNVPVEHIDSYAVNLMKKEDEVRKLIDKLMENKVIGFIRENVNAEVREVSNEEFGKLFNEN